MILCRNIPDSQAQTMASRDLRYRSLALSHPDPSIISKLFGFPPLLVRYHSYPELQRPHQPATKIVIAQLQHIPAVLSFDHAKVAVPRLLIRDGGLDGPPLNIFGFSESPLCIETATGKLRQHAVLIQR